MMHFFGGTRPDVRAALSSILLFWTFYFVLVTTRSYFLGYADPAEMIPRRAAVVVLGIGITWIMFLALRPLERQSLGLRMFAYFLAAIPASAAYAAVNHAFFYLILPPDFILTAIEEKAEGISAWSMILDQAFAWYWFFSAWAAFYIALRYAEEVRAAERRAATWRAEAQSAQLRALRYQINPHFLFNTLNSLSSLILRERNQEADQMVMNLSAFLRTSLQGDPEKLVTLEEEVEQQALYLAVEKSRFGDRLVCEVDIDDDAGRSAAPPMILQPLIENAIKYAVTPSQTPITIRITARCDARRLYVEVRDDGARPAEPIQCGLGTGLRNVKERLRAHFGDSADMMAGERAGGGFRVAMSWPAGPVG
ncbi:MAG: histidine kinase [Pacificimonas sp.]